MATDERPAKMRKLAHGESGSDGEEKAEADVQNGSETVNITPTEDSIEATSEMPPTQGSPKAAEENGQSEPKISKNQLKKQRRLERWEAGREDRKVIRKEKIKAKKERKREEWRRIRKENKAEESQAGGGENSINDDGPTTEDGIRSGGLRERSTKHSNGTQVPITVIFDCDFEDLMYDHELKSLGLQITRCYSDNRKAPFRTHLAVSSFQGKMKERFDGILAKQYTSWTNFRFFEEDFVHVAAESKKWMREAKGGEVTGALSHDDAPGDDEEGEIVYLSSESENTLERLKPNGTYIIGGLVDKNRYKGICHKRAVNRGIKTAKLPIGEFLEMKSRQVLVTNHVLDIMLKWMEFDDWGKAFMEVIPKRKGGVLKSEAERTEDDDNELSPEATNAEEVDVEMGEDSSKNEAMQSVAQQTNSKDEGATDQVLTNTADTPSIVEKSSS